MDSTFNTLSIFFYILCNDLTFGHDMSSLSVQAIAKPVLLGEGPHWDAHTQVLYYVSIKDHTIHKYTPSSGEHAKAKLDGAVGFIVPVEGTTDQFVVGVEREFRIIRWDGRDGSAPTTLRLLAEVDRERTTNRINDGKADPKGRLFAGTMGAEESLGKFIMKQGSLFRLDGSEVTKLVEGVTVSNGLAWDLQRKAFYYTDSFEHNIRKYDYDVNTGEITNKSYIFDFKKNHIEGVPDGSTIDTAGNLWVAVFDGACVLNIDPTTGKLIRKVPIPALQVTSVTFGGPDLDILFVTTANLNGAEPPHGATFMVTGLGVKGHPNVNYKLNIN